MGRIGRIVLAAACLVIAGCTVDGQASAGAVDLSPRAVPSTDFPGGSASRVPPPAVPGALADLTGRPLHGSVIPAQCTPAAVSADGAAVLVGPDPAASTATFTEAIVHADVPLDEVTALARRCPRTASGSSPTAMSAVITEVLPAPRRSGVATGAERRQLTTGGTGSSAITTSTTTLLAQRDGVRVIVEYRHQGAAPMSAQAGARLDALFSRAVDAAFG
ncbi:hypothetical protein [Gordonia insulae]|uniref:DUF5642 domain-containing protein n=1 Tax=Gordonia insulae TaxID=2420509 RepID=A0A3G8JGP6_9ACTN|nr:hypothetical protein [Gordonia insulae]AZG44173.1 hypothetical protein D7316_00753 [Gordonia insulae]